MKAKRLAMYYVSLPCAVAPRTPDCQSGEFRQRIGEVMQLPARKGQPLPYGENWTVALTGASTATNVLDRMPQEIFIVVNLNVTNNQAAQRPSPFDDLTLRDNQDRVSVAAQLPS